MRGVVPLITSCLMIVLTAEPLFAQQRLFALSLGDLVELDTIFLARSRLLETTSSLYACQSQQIAALDVDTGQVRAIADASSFMPACRVDLIRITEPAGPVAFSAQASGHQVRLTWQVSVNATSYQIEAGSAPGLTNLATLDVAGPQLTIDGVPSGIFYLRVRATNTIGRSAPSQEIRLVVQ